MKRLINLVKNEEIRNFSEYEKIGVLNFPVFGQIVSIFSNMARLISIFLFLARLKSEDSIFLNMTKLSFNLFIFGQIVDFAKMSISSNMAKLSSQSFHFWPNSTQI